MPDFAALDPAMCIPALQLRALLRTIRQERDSWKRRALAAETKVGETNYNGAQNVSDLRYGALKRHLARQFHPDYSPGRGIEKIVRNEVFKEIWTEIDRLDRLVSATDSATESPSSVI
jgi:hypothetical protein